MRKAYITGSFKFSVVTIGSARSSGGLRRKKTFFSEIASIRGVNLVQNVGGRPVQGVWETEDPQWGLGAKPR